MFKSILNLTVATTFLFAFNVANAAVLTFSNFINDTNQQVGYDYFSVTQDSSLVTLETFDEFALGNTSAGFDPEMFLFNYDSGTNTIGSLIAQDDDSGSPALIWTNAFITTMLNTGQYVVAVSDYTFSEDEARSGLNQNDLFGSYDLVVTGNVSAVAAVPEPETYAMFLAGLGLLGFVSKRKQA